MTKALIQRNRIRAILILIGVATLLLILNLLQIYFPSNAPRQFRVSEQVLILLPFWYGWVLFWPIIYLIASRLRPGTLRFLPIVWIQITAALGFALLHYVLTYLFLRPWGLYEVLTQETFFWRVIRYFQVATACYVVVFWRAYFREKAKLARLRKSLDFQMLENMKLGFRPDFVLAELNRIRIVAEKDPEEADASITALGLFFRSSLRDSHRIFQSLKKPAETMARRKSTTKSKPFARLRRPSSSYLDLFRNFQQAKQKRSNRWHIAGLLQTWILFLGFFLFRSGFTKNVWNNLDVFGLIQLLVWSLMSALFTVSFMKILKRYPIAGARKKRNLLRHAGFSVLFLIGVNLIFQGYREGLRFPNGFLSLFNRPLLDLLLYWILVGFWHVEYFAESIHLHRVRRIRLEMDFLRAKLEALQMQLHPHFLYNALNSLAELFHEDSRAALLMMDRLIAFLRITLLKKDQPQVSLREEIEFTRCYLDIQKVRFQDRLTVHIEIPDEIQDCLVPALILQPLVENAVRHAVCNEKGQGCIQIIGKLCDGMLELEIMDNGGGFDLRQFIRPGIGISNTRTRLQEIYGSVHQFAISNFNLGAVVKMKIPAHAF